MFFRFLNHTDFNITIVLIECISRQIKVTNKLINCFPCYWKQLRNFNHFVVLRNVPKYFYFSRYLG
jgi:hypothetical protein